MDEQKKFAKLTSRLKGAVANESIKIIEACMKQKRKRAGGIIYFACCSCL